MTIFDHTWTILHRTDWGHAHDSLVPANVHVPKPDAELKVIKAVDAERLAGAVKALESIVSYAYGASGATGDDAGHLTAVGMMAKEALDALGGSRTVSSEEDVSQSRWVVGGCYEENRLRLIEGRALGVHEQLTLVEASE